MDACRKLIERVLQARAKTTRTRRCGPCCAAGPAALQSARRRGAPTNGRSSAVSRKRMAGGNEKAPLAGRPVRTGGALAQGAPLKLLAAPRRHLVALTRASTFATPPVHAFQKTTPVQGHSKAARPWATPVAAISHQGAPRLRIGRAPEPMRPDFRPRDRAHRICRFQRQTGHRSASI